MSSIIDQLVNILGFPTWFEMIFGLIVTIVLFLMDRGEKKRQEETLERQDESLDIILEQVSKVNIFQTKTLSLAIESLGKDLDTFRTDINDLKSAIQNNNFKLDQTQQDILEETSNKTPEAIPTPPLVSLSTNFGELLSNQLNGFVEQIKSNLSNLNKINQTDKTQLYKAKKNLEFDIKDLFNIQALLKEMDSEKNAKEPEQAMVEDNHDNNSNVENVDQPDEKSNIEKDKEPTKIEEKEMKRISKIDFDDLDLQLDNLNSIPEIVKFTETLLKNFEIQNIEGVNPTKIKSEKKKIKPNKIISKKEFNNHE